MEKGFTLIEMIVVLAIMSLLIGFSGPNIVKLNRRSQVDKFAHSFASISSEAYENSSREDDYSKWKIEIDNCYSSDNVSVRLKNGESTVREVEPENIKIALNEKNTNDFSGGIFDLSFDSLGYIHYSSKSRRGTLNDMDIQVSDEDSYDKMMVHIKSLPPGFVTVENIE